MPKFQVDIPEDPEEPTEADEERAEDDRPQFAFRDADPVGVGTGAEEPKSDDFDARAHSLAAILSIALKGHDRLQDADVQLFELSNWIGELKRGAKIKDHGKGVAKKATNNIRHAIITTLVTLEYVDFVLKLDEEGVLGEHEDDLFAELGVRIVDRMKEEMERWGLSTEHLDDIPDNAKALLEKARQVAAEKAGSQ